jgi:hypothetical protein
MIKKSPASLSKPDLLRCSYELCKLQFKFNEKIVPYSERHLKTRNAAVPRTTTNVKARRAV